MKHRAPPPPPQHGHPWQTQRTNRRVRLWSGFMLSSVLSLQLVVDFGAWRRRTYIIAATYKRLHTLWSAVPDKNSAMTWSGSTTPTTMLSHDCTMSSSSSSSLSFYLLVIYKVKFPHDNIWAGQTWLQTFYSCRKTKYVKYINIARFA